MQLIVRQISWAAMSPSGPKPTLPAAEGMSALEGKADALLNRSRVLGRRRGHSGNRLPLPSPEPSLCPMNGVPHVRRR